jgi:isoquinoline 1-oxidoreductase subunit alpha
MGLSDPATGGHSNAGAQRASNRPSHGLPNFSKTSGMRCPIVRPHMKADLVINGESRSVEADADTPLLWVLRDHLGMTGTKFGCGIGQCGACTVHVNGAAARSCLVTLEAAVRTRITTVEGLAHAASHPLQRAWMEDNVPQCGYCQAGMLMAAAALLREHPNPTDAQIDGAINNICRCGTYPRVRAAIHKAAAASGRGGARGGSDTSS